MLTKQQQREIFRRIDNIPQFAGAGVYYQGDMMCARLRPSQHSSGFETYIVLEEARFESGRAGYSQLPPTPPPTAKSKVSDELVGAGLNCVGAVLAGAAAGAGAVATPVSGGTSAVITYIAGAAAIAQAAQCGISVGRVISELVEPNSTDYLDNERWYQVTGNVLDGIGLLGIAASLPSAGKVLQIRRLTGKSWGAILRGLNGTERKRLARELANYSKEISNKQWKKLVRAGKLPKIFQQKAIYAAVKEQLLNAIAAPLSIYSSATSGNIYYIVHVVQN